MALTRRGVATGLAAAAACMGGLRALTGGLAGAPAAALAQTARRPAESVLGMWYRLTLELVRHTPTYSPPVASRAFAYLGVTAFESLASGPNGLRSLAGQLNGLAPVPPRPAGPAHDEAVVLNAALAAAVEAFFGNTGPTGQRAMKAMDKHMSEDVAAGLPEDIVQRSIACGRAVAAHVGAWAAGDGGAVIENMGFPLDYRLGEGPSHWVPTSTIRQQQFPLLPGWGRNRTFAMPDAATCGLPPPLTYSEDPGSDFYREALEVYETSKALTDDQRTIARFWSDDPMLSPTPPGHWISIVLQVLDAEGADAARRVDALARTGIVLADAFIGCWRYKYEYDLVRPVTYIRRFIDPAWETLLITPPFPEYPSGHSTQSAAAAEVLTAFFGEGYAFEDATHADDGFEPRSYPDFWTAAREAAMSRLYGGIHFRAANERGLELGKCIGAHTAALRTRA